MSTDSNSGKLNLKGAEEGQCQVRSIIKNGWFSELIEGAASGQSMSLEVEEVLHQERTNYQDILVFRSKTYGNVLVLDGIINVTDRDEFCYQEMCAHMALNSHPNPQQVSLAKLRGYGRQTPT